MQVVSLQKYKQLKELTKILEETTLTSSDITLLLDTLHEGKTLATALRTIGLRSAYQIPEPVWKELRSFRNHHFPLVAIDPISG